MFRIISLFVLTVWAAGLHAQRRTEIGIEPVESQHVSFNLGSNFVYGEHNKNYLTVFNGTSFSRYYYPVYGGLPLMLPAELNQHPAVLGTSVYLVLQNTSSGRHLYRYSGGGSFTRILTPGTIESNVVVFGSSVYILLNVSGTKQLYRYTGSSFIGVSGSSVPVGTFNRLESSGGFLYIMSHSTSGTYQVKRFNGSVTATLPSFEFYGGISKIFPVPGTPRVYFLVSNYKLAYFDGTAIHIPFDAPGYILECVLWRNNLYFTASVDSDLPGSLYQLTGAARTLVAPPAGAEVMPYSMPQVFDDALYLALRDAGGRKWITKYDGTLYTDVREMPGLRGFSRMTVRDGKLLIDPHLGNSPLVYEYDGISFTEIHAPAGYVFYPMAGSTACNYLWLTFRYIGSTPSFSLSKEARCPPPAPPGPAPVIPTAIRDFEFWKFGALEQGKGWCWSEIEIDWPPLCPNPPCDFMAAMMDKNNQLLWQQYWQQPGSTTVPAISSPVQTVISTGSGKGLVVIDEDLVQKGISSISIQAKPADKKISFSVGTENNLLLPVTIGLINWNGKTIWEKQFTAPFSQTVQDQLAEWGSYLRFSYGGAQQRQEKKQTGNISFNVYPNPAVGRTTLDIQVKQAAPAEIQLVDMLGQIVFRKKLQLPATTGIPLPANGSKQFLLRIVSKEMTVSRLIFCE